MSLIPQRLADAARADYTKCPEVQSLIMAHSDAPYLAVLPYLKELADKDAL